MNDEETRVVTEGLAKTSGPGCPPGAKASEILLRRISDFVVER